MRTAAFCLIVLTASSAAQATNRYFDDIAAQSPSGGFRVDAVSPDNARKVHLPFQANFTYTCVDTRSGAIIWSRRQAMGDPIRLGEDSSMEIANPIEGSPVSVHVSDSGWTVIRTMWDDLIIVTPKGEDVGKIELLKSGLTVAEHKYVCPTTAGPYWDGPSARYFLGTPSDEVFVVRPWWGRRIFVDLKSGQLLNGDQPTLNARAKDEEVQLVLSTLKSEHERRAKEMSRYTAAYLAGVLHIQAAIPSLRGLEESGEFDCSVCGSQSDGETFNNEVDPHAYSYNSTCRIAQLSLRRLGEIPKPLPCYQFELKNGRESTEYEPPPQDTPRHRNAEIVGVGMDARQVLTLLGSPDFVSFETWTYDIDAPTPYCLTLAFDVRRVTNISRDTPPLWKSGTSRDEAIVYW